MEQLTAEIDIKLNRHIAKKRKLEKLMERIIKMQAYRDRKIRELSAQRTISLNMKLPLEETTAGRAA